MLSGISGRSGQLALANAESGLNSENEPAKVVELAKALAIRVKHACLAESAVLSLTRNARKESPSTKKRKASECDEESTRESLEAGKLNKLSGPGSSWRLTEIRVKWDNFAERQLFLSDG